MKTSWGKSMHVIAFCRTLLIVLAAVCSAGEYEDLVKRTEMAIGAQYTDETPLAREIAQKRLLEIVQSDDPLPKKLEDLRGLIGEFSVVQPVAADSDGDGLRDTEDPFPIIADFTEFRWEVRDIVIGWDVTTVMEVLSSEKESESEKEQTENLRILGASGEARFDAAVQAGGGLSTDWREMFGLRSFYAKGNVEKATRRRENNSWSRENRTTAKKVNELVKTMEKRKRIFNPHVRFSIVFFNDSGDNLELVNRPFTIYADDSAVVDAICEDSEKRIEIPRGRDKVTLSWRANLRTTNELKLIQHMEHKPPSIRLENSRVQVFRAPDTGIELVKQYNQMLQRTVEVSLDVFGNDDLPWWRVAKEASSKPVSIRDALQAINKRVKEADPQASFFDIKEGRLVAIGKKPSDTVWVSYAGGSITEISKIDLSTPIGADLRFVGLPRAQLQKAARMKAEEWQTEAGEGKAHVVAALLWAASKLQWPEAQVVVAEAFHHCWPACGFFEKAFEWYLAAARQGNAKAQLQVAHEYFLPGSYLAETDIAEGIKWYHKAAEQGNSEAQTMLGELYMLGQSVEQNLDDAAKWLVRAAKQENPTAHYHLGVLLVESAESEADFQEAVKMFQKAAELGSAFGQHALGLYYIEKAAEEPTLAKKAFWLFWEAARQDHAEAQFSLGWCYLEGTGTYSSPIEAFKYFHKAAEQGHPHAQFFLYVFYKQGIGVEQDHAKAQKWLTESAARGHAEAQCDLGIQYMYGQGVEKDGRAAVQLLESAEEQGDLNACYYLGRCYQVGIGVRQDDQVAVGRFRTAALQEHALAQYQLGWHYGAGRGLPEDFQLSAYWHRKAADQGISEAQCDLGIQYMYGVGVRKDVAEARRLLSESAAQGNKRAADVLRSLPKR